ncbi:MAG: lipid-A-disaccharide synthase [Gemmatimonadota bacterium]
MSAEPTVFLSAGEASGDQHGAELARALRARIPGVRLAGLGGSEMAAAGVELLAGLDRLAVLGFAEVVRHLPDLIELRRDVRAFLLREGVDLLVPIDYPGFNLSLAAWTHRRGIPVLYYIAPQVWAWHESRARRLAKISDEVCVVLPFEEEFLRRHGARARFVGHPLLDRGAARETGTAAAGGPPLLGLFPGSRRQEVERMLPVFLEAGLRLREEIPGLGLAVARSADLPGSLFEGCGPARVVEPEAAAADASAAITKSGTITLQLALADVPMVVGYRVNPLTFAFARRLIRVEHIALVNLVAGREVVPERIQGSMTATKLADAVRPLLDLDSAERARVRAGLAEVRSRLGEPGAAARVAGSAARILEGRRRP